MARARPRARSPLFVCVRRSGGAGDNLLPRTRSARCIVPRDSMIMRL